MSSNTAFEVDLEFVEAELMAAISINSFGNAGSPPPAEYSVAPELTQSSSEISTFGLLQQPLESNPGSFNAPRPLSDEGNYGSVFALASPLQDRRPGFQSGSEVTGGAAASMNTAAAPAPAPAPAASAPAASASAASTSAAVPIIPVASAAVPVENTGSYQRKRVYTTKSIDEEQQAMLEIQSNEVARARPGEEKAAIQARVIDKFLEVYLERGFVDRFRCENVPDEFLREMKTTTLDEAAAILQLPTSLHSLLRSMRERAMGRKQKRRVRHYRRPEKEVEEQQLMPLFQEQQQQQQHKLRATKNLPKFEARY